jgi:hypothetical protein
MRNQRFLRIHGLIIQFADEISVPPDLLF